MTIKETRLHPSQPGFAVTDWGVEPDPHSTVYADLINAIIAALEESEDDLVKVNPECYPEYEV